MTRRRTLLRVLIAAAVASLWPIPVLAALPAPGDVIVTATSPGQVTLAWNAVAGATSYRVYRDVDPVIAIQTVLLPTLTFILTPNAQLVATVTGTSYVDSALPPLVRQFYTVVAVNDQDESAPAIGVEVITPAEPDAPIFGMADLHSHQFANLGFGRRLVWGQAFSPAGIYDALPFCNVVHGAGGLDDIIGNALSTGNPFSGHLVGGADPNWDTAFDGWPAFDSLTHQQMYYDWLHRAFEGGLRLIVMHAVNNKLLCVLTLPDPQFSCDDMANVDAQLDMAKSLQDFVDQRSGGQGRGWYQIAYSASEARHIINSGRMAVVLGIEVDELFGCGVLATCQPERVQTQLDHYYEKGVRHLFPLHVFDNAFGGAALYNPLFNWGNLLITGSFFGTRECAGAGYGDKARPPGALEGLVASLLGLPTPPVTTFTAECNDRRLTTLGGTLVRGMMARKMIIDVDHMSALTTDDVLSIAESIHYPAIVAGHPGMLPVSFGHKASEGQKTWGQMARMRALGGIVGPILEQGERATAGAPNGILQYPGGGVANDCGSSSKTFAQAYLSAVVAFGGPSVASVGFGSDFNGLAGLPGPRFGGSACKGDPGHGVQTGEVVYPFPIVPPPGVVSAGHLGMSSDPTRLVKNGIFDTAHFKPWDYNSDGLAHAGMLPDFVEDLRVAGITDLNLQPLFRSAEGYIRMWERAEQLHVNPPTAILSQLPAAGPTGWNTTDVTVLLTGTPSSDGLPVKQLQYSATGAFAAGPSTVVGASGSLVVSAEGTTVVSLTASDAFNNTSVPATLTLGIDKTNPQVVCGTADGAWHSNNVDIGCAATDVPSGLAAPEDAAFSLSTAVPAGIETAMALTGPRTVPDVAGRSSIAGPIGGNKIDRKGPTITIDTPPAGAPYLVHQTVAASYLCADGGSGISTCAGPVANGTPIDTVLPGTHTFVVNASDNVGNTASASMDYVVAFRICPQYDESKVKNAGSVVPIKIELCDATGANLSSAGVRVTAIGLTRASSNVTGQPDDAGSANPDGNFRFDPSAGFYIFNLSTRGLSAGTWHLSFVVDGDPTTHTTSFQIR